MSVATLEELHKICLAADTRSFFPNLDVCKVISKRFNLLYGNQASSLALNLELKLRPRRSVCLVVFSKAVQYGLQYINDVKNYVNVLDDRNFTLVSTKF